MDDFSLQGEELRDALDKIASINRLLGGNKVTLGGMAKLLKKANRSQPITIADIGCGNGDMLRVLADYAQKRDLDFRLIGIDANAFTINYAQTLSKGYTNIDYRCIDILDPDFTEIKYDIVLCTLTLHHFTDQQIASILTTFNTNATLGTVVNDLHRSSIAYRLFQMICALFGLNRMSREDGLVSILRGFKRQELEDFSKQLNFKHYSIHWKWAFRYQWLISKI